VILLLSFFRTSAFSHDPSLAATLAEVTTQRNAFIDRVHSFGLTCPVPAPVLVVDHVPSFGNYDDSNNTLHISDWSLLTPEERAAFVRLAGEGATESTARQLFDQSVHRWVFVHELGHWWQACRAVIPEKTPPYKLEVGANRIALAFWRTTDLAFANRMLVLFQGLLDHSPSPVPAGESVEPYFSKNYRLLGSSDAYPWFQAYMIINLSREKPSPSFVAALRSTKPE
jgi:hypothetical protein